MAEDSGSKEQSFVFASGYRAIARHIEEEYGRKASLEFYDQLIEYALGGEKPEIPESDSFMTRVWGKVEEMVAELRGTPSKDGGKTASTGKPRRRAAKKTGGRLLEDLDDKELDAIAKDYSVHVGYPELYAKYGIKYGTLDSALPTKVKVILHRRNQGRAADVLSARFHEERTYSVERWEHILQELANEGLTPSESEELIGLMGLNEDSLMHVFPSIRRVKELMRHPSCFTMRDLLEAYRAADSCHNSPGDIAKSLDALHAEAGEEPEVGEKNQPKWKEELW